VPLWTTSERLAQLGTTISSSITSLGYYRARAVNLDAGWYKDNRQLQISGFSIVRPDYGELPTALQQLVSPTTTVPDLHRVPGLLQPMHNGQGLFELDADSGEWVS